MILSSSIIEKFFGDYLTSRQTDRRMYINLNVIFVSLYAHTPCWTLVDNNGDYVIQLKF